MVLKHRSDLHPQQHRGGEKEEEESKREVYRKARYMLRSEPWVAHLRIRPGKRRLESKKQRARAQCKCARSRKVINTEPTEYCRETQDTVSHTKDEQDLEDHRNRNRDWHEGTCTSIAMTPPRYSNRARSRMIAHDRAPGFLGSGNKKSQCYCLHTLVNTDLHRSIPFTLPATRICIF